jgi:hypothetical protein
MHEPRGTVSRTSPAPSVDEIRRRVISDLVDLELRSSQPAPRRPRMSLLRSRARGSHAA